MNTPEHPKSLGRPPGQLVAGWIWSLLILACLGLAGACEGFADEADADGGSSSTGTAPTISDLTFPQGTMTVGELTYLPGSLEFSDPEGDIEELVTTVTLPDGTAQVLSPTPLENPLRAPEGSIDFDYSLTPPDAGTYTFANVVIDAAGNRSNQLAASIDAVP